MKIFSLFDRRGRVPPQPEGVLLAEDVGWSRDPLSHPTIEHMSQRELADLPFRMTAMPTPLECCRPA
jgi:hypothetical protein